MNPDCGGLIKENDLLFKTTRRSDFSSLMPIRAKVFMDSAMVFEELISFVDKKLKLDCTQIVSVKVKSFLIKPNKTKLQMRGTWSGMEYIF